ncbi:SdpI family protein [Haloactinopolyspora alba]|uniref:SdpI family protein n=1 Tax=Haloactinopolyspora alba TaxID=648780 RepID=UPI0013ECCF8B|nr:SdpI family protein [Haloactinopolyspora alba]
MGLLGLAVVLHSVNRAIVGGNLERNAAVGVRTKVTKSSDVAWHAGHLAAAPSLLAAARTGYVAGAATAVAALVPALTGRPYPALLVIPCCATVTLVVLLLIGTRKANEAGRDAADDSGS